ncbi:MAG: flippase-like domain-containing protein [Ruminococcaceae bacterium]|nr:flippase-like domain-containing protein [Oscillospiraceae bacterium]
MQNKNDKTDLQVKNEKKKSSKILWTLLFILIAVLTVVAVTSQSENFSFSEFVDFVGSLDIKYVICAFLAMIGFILFEGLALRTIATSFGYKRSVVKNYNYSAADIYFSAITPSATGGQPASALFMIQDGIPGSVTTVILLVNLVMYTFGIIALGILGFVLNPSIFLNFSGLSKALIIIGSLTQLAIAFGFIMLLVHGNILYKIGNFFISLLAKIKIIKNPDKKREKLKEAITTYTDVVHQIKDKKLMLLKAFILNFLQRASLIAVTLFAFLSSGGKLAAAVDIWVTQSMVILGSNTVPIPGAMGVADYLMLDAFGELMSESIAINLELLSRTISFYFCVIICGISFMLRCIIFQFRKKENEK